MYNWKYFVAITCYCPWLAAVNKNASYLLPSKPRLCCFSFNDMKLHYVVGTAVETAWQPWCWQITYACILIQMFTLPVFFPVFILTHWSSVAHMDGLVQERCKSSALAMELCLSCTNSSIYASVNEVIICFRYCLVTCLVPNYYLTNADLLRVRLLGTKLNEEWFTQWITIWSSVFYPEILLEISSVNEGHFILALMYWHSQYWTSDIWPTYFVWNFKATFWNSPQNSLSIHWKM